MGIVLVSFRAAIAAGVVTTMMASTFSLSSKFLQALGVRFSISALNDEVLSLKVAELPEA